MFRVCSPSYFGAPRKGWGTSQRQWRVGAWGGQGVHQVHLPAPLWIEQEGSCHRLIPVQALPCLVQSLDTSMELQLVALKGEALCVRWASTCRDQPKGHLNGHCRYLGAPLASSSFSCPFSPTLCPTLSIPTALKLPAASPASRWPAGRGHTTLLALPRSSQQLLQPFRSQRRHSSLLRESTPGAVQ